VLSKLYNQTLAEQLHQQFLIPQDRAEQILNYIAEFTLYALTFKGAINTPFGKLVLSGDAIEIAEQNHALQGVLKSELSEEAFRQRVHDLVSGN